jgi:hypothetical protein
MPAANRSKHCRYSITSLAATSSGLWHGEAEYLSGLRVDDEFELSPLHDWQLRRFGAPHNPRMTMMPSTTVNATMNTPMLKRSGIAAMLLEIQPPH